MKSSRLIVEILIDPKREEEILRTIREWDESRVMSVVVVRDVDDGSVSVLDHLMESNRLVSDMLLERMIHESQSETKQ